MISLFQHVQSQLTMQVTWLVGDTYRFSCTYGDGQVPSVPVDLSGYTAMAHVRADREEPVPLGQMQVSLLGAVPNNVSIALSSASSLSLGVGRFFFDVQLTSPLGVVLTPITGEITLVRDISR